jgi:iron-sulfur cluster repair protein YtfE (RIC family)
MNAVSPDPENYERVLEEHRALKELLEKIDRALTERCATIDQVSGLLAQFGDQLVRHFSMEEDSGYFADALLQAPRLVSRANELMAQHPKMCTKARDLIPEVGGAQPKQDWWQETRKRFDAFREELLKHEQGEDRLLQEAYNEDLGAND